MKTKIIMMTALVALLATGCVKDKTATRVSLHAENMATTGHGAKIFMNPANAPDYDAEWVAGEPISLKGDGAANDYDIVKAGTKYSLENVTATGTRYAIYPGTYTSAGNDVSVENYGATGSITINELALNFHNGGADVIFPMVAKSHDTDNELWFHHLTAGIILQLKARSATAAAGLTHVSRLEVILFRQDGSYDPTNTVDISGVGSYEVSWAEQGMLPLPGGGIGSGYSQDVKYASVMNFNLKEGGNDFVAIDETEGISFCAPVTMSEINRITVNGYDDSGEQVFTKTSMLGSPLNLEWNNMYKFPELLLGE